MTLCRRSHKVKMSRGAMEVRWRWTSAECQRLEAEAESEAEAEVTARNPREALAVELGVSATRASLHSTTWTALHPIRIAVHHPTSMRWLAELVTSR